jgi:AraC family transcriptional regulator
LVHRKPLAGEITLEEIARVSGVSRYYSSRAFGEATGHSVMHHVRGRRLTEAARSLSAGASDILSVALDAGYGSHEAFDDTKIPERFLLPVYVKPL